MTRDENLARQVAKRREYNLARRRETIEAGSRALGFPLPARYIRMLEEGVTIRMSQDIEVGLPAHVLRAMDQPNSYGVKPSQYRRMRHVLGDAETSARVAEWHLRGKPAGVPHPALEF